MKDFYRAALARVAAESAEPVTSGARIWNTYSHGFIVKTASSTIAFDVVRSRTPFDSWAITYPDEIISRIDVLFASHEHGDHYDDRFASFIPDERAVARRCRHPAAQRMDQQQRALQRLT